MDHTSPSSAVLRTEQTCTRWWRERELLWLVALVLGVYFTRPLGLTLRGEETRRGRIAYEMLHNNDWLVPRVQGQPLISRPPLQNWLIAWAGVARGRIDALAVRIPSLVATLLTCLLIYGYGRQSLSSLGALAAAASYATLFHVLALGRLGETEALFTLLLSASLLLWHWGYRARCNPLVLWSASYLLVACGMLTKGLQSPVYFAGTVGAYLFATRDPRFALSRSHAAGILILALVVGTWQVAFTQRLGMGETVGVYGNDVVMRFADAGWGTVIAHLVTYPVELFAGCLAPWSVLLLAFANRQFRQTLAPWRDLVLYLAISLMVAFPFVWLPPGSRPRYFMPLYPEIALLIGLVFEQVLLAQPQAGRVWSWFLRLMAFAMIASAAAIATVSFLRAELFLAQPASVVLVYAACAGFGAWISVRALRAPVEQRHRLALLAIAGFVGLTYNLVAVNAMQRKSVDAVGEVAELRRKLPPNTKLVSFGLVSHLFLFHYVEDVPLLPWPKQADDVPEDVEYFCINVVRNVHPPLPFAWEPVATVNCDRTQRAEPIEWIVIGRRVRVAERPSETTRR